MTACVGFGAIADVNARVVILGTLPGVVSLRQGEYYANKVNSFWNIMGDLVGASAELPYDDRLNCLKKHNIALWDVCAAGEREGSLDSNILSSSIVPNDFDSFFKTHTHIQLIAFNGQPAEKLFCRKVLGTVSAVSALRRQCLPSTSPAHARMRFEEKRNLWRAALEEFIR
jgi:hypoxanthine-DNA glycosylase